MLIKLQVMPRPKTRLELKKLKLLLKELPLRVMPQSKRKELRLTKKLTMLPKLLMEPPIKLPKLSRMPLKHEIKIEF